MHNQLYEGVSPLFPIERSEPERGHLDGSRAGTERIAAKVAFREWSEVREKQRQFLRYFL
ncbi:MAG: hypothetical protein V4616_10385 [Bacteroidota bacterium]